MMICPHCEQIELRLKREYFHGAYLHCWVCGKVIYPEHVARTEEAAEERIKEEQKKLKEIWHKNSTVQHHIKRNGVVVNVKEHHNNGRRRTAPEIVEKVRQLREQEKLSYRALSARFNINTSTIQRILLHKCGY